MTETIIVNLPFEGFYYSKYSDELDQQANQWAEYEAEYREEENGIAPELRLTQEEFGEILFDCYNCRESERLVCAVYVDAFNEQFEEHCGINLGLKFESMTSPRFYNFETDRIFAHMATSALEAMFSASAKEEHATLRAIIEERHTSRSGFHSFYPNDLDTWLNKPLEDWDHNEICTLIIATLERCKVKDFDWDVYYRCIDNDGLLHEWEAGVDWKKLDEKIAEAREEKRLAYLEANPEIDAALLEPRCPHTLDLFKPNA